MSALLGASPQQDMDAALHVASSMGHEAAGKQLILAGADVNFEHPIDKSTPLHKAVSGDCELLVNDLLQAGAIMSPQKADLLRRTPLHTAASKGCGEIVSALLRKGADVDELDAWGNSPLIWATHRGHLAVVQTLLTAGADTSVGGCMEGTLASSALSFAAEQGCLDIMDHLINAGADVDGNAAGITGLPALHCATSRGQVGAIDKLIKAGANIEMLDREGMTPLFRAADESSFHAMELLLEHGAAVNTKGPDGNTALHLVCHLRHHHFDNAVRRLLLKGADETALDSDGQTPSTLLNLPLPRWPPISPHEIQRARELLARAPADRAWRRRGWLVLLRARAENEKTAKCRKVGEGDIVPPSGDGAGGSANGDRCAATEEEEAEKVLRGAVDMLVRRAPEGVFRAVVELL